MQKPDENNTKKYDLGAISISVYERIDSTAKAPIFNRGEIIRTETIPIDQKNVIHNTHKNEFTDPNQTKSTLYTDSYSFEWNNKYINISISSLSDNLIEYNALFRHMIKSMYLK